MNKNSSIAIIAGVAIAVAVIASVFAFSGISNDTAPSPATSDEVVQTPLVPQEEKITVLTSFYPYHEFTKNVAGDFAEVKQFMPAGVEAHDWEPRAQEIQSLLRADVFVYNGLGMESYVDQIMESGEFDNVLFVKASEGVELIEFEDDHAGHDDHDDHAKEEGHDDHDDHDDHGKGGHDGHDHDYEFDPHIWLDPILVKQQVNVIRDGLIEADPQNKEHYEENARIYNNKMDALDMKINSALSSCQKDTIVPYHNAFSYLGERYDIHIMALGGMAPDSEASAAEIAEFVDFVKENDIKVIFSEELVDPRLAEVIAAEANAQVLLFSPLEALTPEEADRNVSYIDKMEDNLDSLKVALECQ